MDKTAGKASEMEAATSMVATATKTIRRVDSPSIPAADTKLRVAAYARVSSGKDAMLHSLSAQISHYSRQIQSNPAWQFVGVYADEATTGTKDNRAEFQRLLADCRLGKIDMVLTKSVTRFARNAITTIETVRELRLLGIDVFFERENIHSIDASGELMLTILASFAQEESRSASENCKWRIRKMFEAGRPNTGRMLGYKLVDGKLEIIEDEAEIIRRIFDYYLSGMGVTAIMCRLIAEEVPTLRGGGWRESTIHSILRNEKYTGDMVLQKTYRENYLTKRWRSNKGELPQYYVCDSHEAIIDKNMFQRVKDEIARRKAALDIPDTPPKHSVFSGLIICDGCGKSYRRKTNNAGTKYAHVVWLCNTFNRLGKAACAAKQIPETILLELTCKAIGIESVATIHDGLFEATAFERIRQIIVSGSNTLTFALRNGDVVVMEWQKPSRRDSWTPAMREAARQKKLAYYQRLKAAKQGERND